MEQVGIGLCWGKETKRVRRAGEGMNRISNEFRFEGFSPIRS
mgnify:FL=1